MKIRIILLANLVLLLAACKSVLSTPSVNRATVVQSTAVTFTQPPIKTMIPITTPLAPLLPTWTITPAAASDWDLARHALLMFFTLLHDAKYAEAVALYGGNYDSMRSNNPEIPADDYASLWKAACTVQRPACLLVASIVEQASISKDEYKFLIEFIGIDGTLFTLGPCCGATETEMPPVWQFTYTVKKIDMQFKVMEEPVYVP